MSQSLVDRIHFQALEISTRYKRAEADLVEILQQAEEHRVFIERGHSSLFAYVVSELGLSESTTYSLITISRKARQVPELKAQLQTGAITLSNAHRIASVLTPENQAVWLEKASSLTTRQIEKEVALVRPQEATREKATYVAPNRIQLEVGLSESAMIKLRRVQDLLSQTEKRPVSLEQVIERLSDEHLQRHDPVEKATRHQARKAQTKTLGKLCTRRETRRREPIPASVLHQVNLRDQRRCTHFLTNGKRCDQSRWIEIHHKVPVNQGGPNTVANLITLCSAHHKFSHQHAGKVG